MLVEQAYMPNLKRLHSMNNQITELPDMEPLIKLEWLNLSNQKSEDRRSNNRIK